MEEHLQYLKYTTVVYKQAQANKSSKQHNTPFLIYTVGVHMIFVYSITMLCFSSLTTTREMLC